MSLRTTLRTAVLAVVATGAVILPTAAAVADDTPTATPTPSVAAPAASPSPTAGAAEPSASASPAPSEVVTPGTMPRGGVDAGERPAHGTDDTTLYGSATGAVLLAGACALVLRRRSAARHDG